jgi:DNA-binding IclR family transcriptional regulator
MKFDPNAKPGVPEVRAVLRAIAILRAFPVGKPACSLAEITHATGLNKSTVRRLLHTLQIAGLITNNDQEQTYSLTLDLADIASRVLQGRDLVTMARPFLSELSELCAGIAFLWAFDKVAGVCLDRVVALSSFITPSITPGNRSSLNCGAGPRAVLAHIDPADRAAALAQPQAHRTRHSVTGVAELEDRCTLIRSRGYEFVADDFIAGLAALGVPVFGRDGHFVGALSITNLTSRFVLDRDGEPEWFRAMKDAADQLGARLT